MENTDEKTVTEILSENVLNTRFEDIDRETVDNTKWRIIDTIGCAIGGTRAPGNAELIELVKGWGGKPEATILADGARGPVHDVAMLNCVLSRGFDRGPLTLIINGKRVPNHTSETTVLTAVTVGESQAISGKELIAALVVGDDLAARLHIANDRPLPGQGPPGQEMGPRTGAGPRGTVSAFGAAAIAGRVVGLDTFQMRNAFGIAISMMAGGSSGLWEGASTFGKLNQGTEARSGINAAQLAKAGWIGIPDAFFGERGGFYHGLSGCSNPERVTEDLGKKYHVEVVFKPYPGGRPTHAPIEAALALGRKHDFKVEEIEEAILRTSPLATAAHYAKPYKVGDYPTGDALFSYKYSVASALVRKHAGNEDYTEESVRDPAVQTLIGKIKLANLDRPEGVELELKMKDGRKLSEYVRLATGEPSNPLSRDGLIAKFMEQVDFSQTVSKRDAEELIGLLERLEEINDIAEIVGLAVKR
ncbi:MmgE/PrpD family protein [Chloroflexota bacterium]